MQTGNEKEIKRNLRDAGCSKCTADSFIEHFNRDEVGQALNILKKHREELLCECHKCQKKIDCLDYLIFEIEK